MKTKILLLALVASISLIHSSMGQGVLTPAGAPGPTMKSLAQIEPRTPISSLPFNITASGSYYLTGNLTGTGGITINSSDTTVDLGGFAVIGGVGSVGSGITINSAGTLKNITVRNGTIRGWSGHGVVSTSSSARNLVFEHLNISDAGQDGIIAINAAISDCSISSSGIRGITATACTINNCSVTGSSNQGISLSGGTLSHCVIQSSAVEGVSLDGPGCMVNDNLIKSSNTGNFVLTDALAIHSANNRIENNQIIAGVVAASSCGISYYDFPTGNVVVKNQVSGYGANNYGLSAPIIFGPIITATGSIATTSPWANFSY